MSKQQKAFQQHAAKYGSDGVMETAVEAGLSLPELVEVQKACDKAEDARTPRIAQKKRRLSAEARVKRLLGIEDDQEGAAA